MGNKYKISDELLSAYLEGNATEEETWRVLQAMKDDKELRETLETALDLDTDALPAEVLPAMQMAAESGENICSVCCEICVLRRRAIAFDENTLLKTAREKGWLRPEGAPLHAIGQLLANKGLMITRKYDATLDDLRTALEYDNDIIVAVDSDKLHPGQPDEEDAPNHAVVVTGIDADSIAIYDPQVSPAACDETQKIPTCDFLAAWRESCNYMVRVLQSPEEYTPQPIDIDDIALTGELTELREAIAENAHDVWAATRMKEGWTYGKVRDDAHKKHPDLIPYSALSDSEKDYDRLMALNTIKLVKKLGFDITKRK